MIKKIIGFLFLLVSLNILAQKTNVSPYSYFGLGDESGNKTVQEIGMGEIGGAFNSSYQLSFTNPASYGFLQLTSYNFAFQNKAIRIDDGTNKGNASNASFSYLALGFPIGKRAGLAFGLKPKTTVGYSLLQEFTNDQSLTESNLFSGEGGLNSVFLGLGHKIGSNFSIGVEGSYIFGSLINTLHNRRSTVPLATIQKSDANLSGFILKGGIQYQTKVNEKLTLKSGIVLEANNTISNKGDEYRFSLLNVPDNDIVSPRDTTLARSFTRKYKNPAKTILSAGLGEENKWYAGIEYEFRDALTFDDGFDQNNVISSYTKSNRLSLGGYYIPKINSISNYWQRITYRAGVKFEKTGLIVNNKEIDNLGMSFGVALPLGRQLSKVDVGIEFGQQGATTDNLIKENYLNFRVGLSLTDKWFRKQKLN